MVPLQRLRSTRYHSTIDTTPLSCYIELGPDIQLKTSKRPIEYLQFATIQFNHHASKAIPECPTILFRLSRQEMLPPIP